MTIDADVQAAAAQFGLDPHLIQAVVTAEGNILKAVQCSLPSVTTRAQALDVTCRSAVHAMSDYLKADPARRGEFIRFWGARWCPVGAENDPNGLNKNWVSNVDRIWSGSARV